MILTQKLSTIAFGLHDGSAPPSCMHLTPAGYLKEKKGAKLEAEADRRALKCADTEPLHR